MTMTVKLPAALEQGLRQRSAALGRPASELMRDALRAYLSDTKASATSAYELGQDLFGLHGGPVDLAANRKEVLLEVWAEKIGSQQGRPRPVAPSANATAKARTKR
jgi:Arc/MetJ-type ribon-helix-helix transcriptional regulator